MDDRIKEHISELMGSVNCRKGFQCAEKGIEELCRARDIGIDNALECLDSGAVHCSFARGYGEGYFCRCPIRVYLAKQVQSGSGREPSPRDA